MKILFVCLGNICRSPLAEGILKDNLQKKKLNIFVDSAGTESFHVGQHPDVRAIKAGKKFGIDISKLVARQFSTSDFDNFDKIYVAAQDVYDEVLFLARNQQDKNKVDFILNFLYPNSNRPVPDPYYGGDDGFEAVVEMLDEACEKIIESFKK